MMHHTFFIGKRCTLTEKILRKTKEWSYNLINRLINNKGGWELEKDTRTKLIAAATRLFAEKGYEGVSIRELAQQAGVNSALISYHFSGKEGLYTAVLENQFTMMLELADRILHNSLTPEQKIREYAVTVLSIHQSSPTLIRFLYSELFHPSPCFEVITQRFLAKIFQTLALSFTEGIAKGQFRPDLNVENAVISLAGIMNFYFIARPLTQNLVAGSEAGAQAYIEQALEIFLAGIRRGNKDG